ncbi:hypothetical protein [Nocardia puris]|uniref:hypothetical protein n=1 Tax=Nocardia puris TaxID=208602 RepID=UPI00082E5DC9|nr:hypothetical protein [Nocardia puris]
MEIHSPVVLHAPIEDGDDVRMVQLGDHIALAFEPHPDLVVAEHLPVQQLQCGEAGQPGMSRRVHRAHAAVAELALDHVPGEQLTSAQHDCLPRYLGTGPSLSNFGVGSPTSGTIPAGADRGGRTRDCRASTTADDSGEAVQGVTGAGPNSV